ncbi:unnamed protein product, partial [Oppiella nova]
MQISRDNGFSSLALSAINTPNRGYPRQSAAHIALRVVRRFLEHYSDSIDLIIFAVDDTDIGFYELLMPLYFPRSEPEEEYARYQLPQDVGGQYGEPVIPEREIRIAAKPNTLSTIEESVDLSSGLDTSVAVGKTTIAAKPNTLSTIEESVDLSSGLDTSVAVGKTTFAKMHGDLDKRHKRQASLPLKDSDPMTQEIQRQHKYERLLRKAKTEDFSDYITARCLYISGEDSVGRPVVVMNLKCFYVIHPSIWCRVIVWWFTTFNATLLKRKLFCVGGVEYLKVNGVRYSEVQSPQQQTNDNL